MAALARQGKRSIVALNKKDRLLDVDREAILAKLRERLAGLVAPARRGRRSRRPPGRCPCGSRGSDGTHLTTVLEAEAARHRGRSATGSPPSWNAKGIRAPRRATCSSGPT